MLCRIALENRLILFMYIYTSFIHRIIAADKKLFAGLDTIFMLIYTVYIVSLIK